jgi:hypothetical protein
LLLNMSDMGDAVMPKFKIILERTDTITKHAEVMVEATSAEQARKFILADLGVDAGSYDDDLTVIEDGVGEMMVKVETDLEAPPKPLRVAARD